VEASPIDLPSRDAYIGGVRCVSLCPNDAAAIAGCRDLLAITGKGCNRSEK
jgi:hypothetical protein